MPSLRCLVRGGSVSDVGVAAGIAVPAELHALSNERAQPAALTTTALLTLQRGSCRTI